MKFFDRKFLCYFTIYLVVLVPPLIFFEWKFPIHSWWWSLYIGISAGFIYNYFFELLWGIHEANRAAKLAFQKMIKEFSAEFTPDTESQ